MKFGLGFFGVVSGIGLWSPSETCGGSELRPESSELGRVTKYTFIMIINKPNRAVWIIKLHVHWVLSYLPCTWDHGRTYIHRFGNAHPTRPGSSASKTNMKILGLLRFYNQCRWGQVWYYNFYFISQSPLDFIKARTQKQETRKNRHKSQKLHAQRTKWPSPWEIRIQKLCWLAWVYFQGMWEKSITKKEKKFRKRLNIQQNQINGPIRNPIDWLLAVPSAYDIIWTLG